MLRTRRPLTGATILFLVIAAFAGGFGGMYLGGLLSGDGDNNPETIARQLYFERRGTNLNLVPGDLFPLESYTSAQGATGNFEMLLADKKTVFIFLSMDCEPCFELAKLWQTELLERVKENVQVVVMLREGIGTLAPEFATLLNGITVVYINHDYWLTTYNLITWPTIIGVDNSGFIVAIQETFPGYLDMNLVNYFLDPQGSTD